MEFKLACSCGKSVAVTEGAAGASVSCACGRELQVPSLNALHRLAGLPAHQASASLVLQHMLQNGELPGNMPCVGCGGTPHETHWVIAECEWMWFAKTGETAAMVMGLLVDPILTMIKWQSRGEPEARGRTLTFRLPLPLCQECRHHWEPALYQRLLMALPKGAAVFLGGWLFLWLVMKWQPFAAETRVALVCGFVLLWLLGRAAKRQEQASLRAWLCRVPIYQHLMDVYREAKLHRDWT